MHHEHKYFRKITTTQTHTHKWYYLFKTVFRREQVRLKDKIYIYIKFNPFKFFFGFSRKKFWSFKFYLNIIFIYLICV